MYLSKFDLDLRSPSVRQAMRNCEDMHRNIQRCFHCDRNDGGVLYRVRQGNHVCSAYVLSAVPVANIPSGMTLVGCRDMIEYEQRFAEGQQYGFDLLCMPSKKIPNTNSKNSRRVVLRTPSERMEWMERKARDYGFSVLPGSLQELSEQTIFGAKASGKMVFQATQFTGRLCIVDSEKFRKAWRNGIGPEKAYGLGMLFLVK